MCKPDLTIYLRLDPTTASQRAGFGNESTEKLDIQTRVIEEYDMYARNNPDTWVVIDASQSVDEVYGEVFEAVSSAMARRIKPLSFISNE